MAERFDAYHKWLGIPSGEQPPHHYRLLGIALFEGDRDVIESAADQRMAHLRSFQAGGHAAMSQKLLNEVAAAKLCLLTPEKKAAYDAALKKRGRGTAKAETVEAVPVVVVSRPMPAGATSGVRPGGSSAGNSTGKPGARRPAILACLGAALLLVAAVAVYSFNRAADVSGDEHSQTSATVAEAETRPQLDPKLPDAPTQTAAKPVAPPEPQSELVPVVSPDVSTEPPASTQESQPAGTSLASVGTVDDSVPVNEQSAPGTVEPSAPPLAVAPFNAEQARAHQEAWGAYLKVPVDQVNSIGIRLALIPPGEFTMGSTPEQVAAARKMLESLNIQPSDEINYRLAEEAGLRRTKLSKPFLAGCTEVTIGQFKRFVEATGYKTECERIGFGQSAATTANSKITEGMKKMNWRAPGYVIGEHTAVSQVTWNDAVEFCNWLSRQDNLPPCYQSGEDGKWPLAASGQGYRLLTEAEWEYCCRAGTNTLFFFGDDASQLKEFAWCKQNAGSGVMSVGMKRPNAFGLLDMYGNVFEFCHDWYRGSYDKNAPTTDPFGATQGTARVVRGGCWLSDAFRCRSALRHGGEQTTFRHNLFGFRVMRVSTAPVPAPSSPPSKELASQEAKPVGGDSSKEPPAKAPTVASDTPAGKFTAKELFSLKQHTAGVTRVAFHPGLPLLASAGKDGRVLLWNLSQKAVQAEFGKFEEEVWALKFGPNGEVLTFGNRHWWGSSVVFKNVSTALELRKLKDFKKSGGGSVESIAYSPDGQLFAVGQGDGAIRLWETTLFAETSPVSFGSKPFNLAFGLVTVDRKRKRTEYLLAVGCEDGLVRTLAVTFSKGRNGVQVAFKPTDVEFPKQRTVTGLRFSADGKLLGVARHGGQISLYDPATGGSVRELTAGGDDVAWLSFHHDRPWCITGHMSDRVARLWNTETAEMLGELKGHTGGVLCAEFSREGRHIATASEDMSIKVWELTSPELPELPKRARKPKLTPLIVGE